MSKGVFPGFQVRISYDVNPVQQKISMHYPKQAPSLRSSVTTEAKTSLLLVDRDHTTAFGSIDSL